MPVSVSVVLPVRDDAPALRRLMLEAGFATAHVRLLNFGTVAVHVGRR